MVHRKRFKLFKIYVMGRDEWILTDPAMIDEYKRIPEDVFSFEVATREVTLSPHLSPASYFSSRYKALQAELLLASRPIWQETSYHVPVIRSVLTREIENILPEAIDEISNSFTQELNSTEDGPWPSCVDASLI